MNVPVAVRESDPWHFAKIGAEGGGVLVGRAEDHLELLTYKQKTH